MNYYFLMTYKTAKKFEIAIHGDDYFGIIREYEIIDDNSNKKKFKKLSWTFLNPPRLIEFGLPEYLLLILDFYVKAYFAQIMELPSKENYQYKKLEFHI